LASKLIIFWELCQEYYGFLFKTGLEVTYAPLIGKLFPLVSKFSLDIVKYNFIISSIIQMLNKSTIKSISYAITVKLGAARVTTASKEPYMTNSTTAQIPYCQHPEHQVAPSSVANPAVLERAAKLFYALGDAARLRLLANLLSKELCVTQLAIEFNEEISTISQRLKLLRMHGLVNRRREGKHIFYRLADQHIVDLVTNALAHASEPKATD
jgi:ArsR family transcriptional regulator